MLQLTLLRESQWIWEEMFTISEELFIHEVKCSTSIVNAESRLCECFLQQLISNLNTFLGFTMLLFFTTLA